MELPEEVYEWLNLSEGQEVKVEIVMDKPASKITWGSLVGKLSREEIAERLKASQGVWADDEKIAEVFEYLERKWKEWDEEIRQTKF